MAGAPHLNCTVAAVGESLGREKVRRDYVVGSFSARELGAKRLPPGREPVLTNEPQPIVLLKTRRSEYAWPLANFLRGASVPGTHALTPCSGPPRPQGPLCLLAEASHYTSLGFRFCTCSGDREWVLLRCHCCCWRPHRHWGAPLGGKVDQNSSPQPGPLLGRPESLAR